MSDGKIETAILREALSIYPDGVNSVGGSDSDEYRIFATLVIAGCLKPDGRSRFGDAQVDCRITERGRRMLGDDDSTPAVDGVLDDVARAKDDGVTFDPREESAERYKAAHRLVDLEHIVPMVTHRATGIRGRSGMVLVNCRLSQAIRDQMAKIGKERQSKAVT